MVAVELYLLKSSDLTRIPKKNLVIPCSLFDAAISSSFPGIYVIQFLRREGRKEEMGSSQQSHVIERRRRWVWPSDKSRIADLQPV